MPEMTGQTVRHVMRLALDRLAGGEPVKLVNVLRLREIRNADGLGRQVSRWVEDDGPLPRADVFLRALDALKAIDWDALKDPPGSAEAAKPDIRDQTAEIRGRIEQRPIDPPDQEEEESTS